MVPGSQPAPPVALPPASPHADDPPRYAMIRPKAKPKSPETCALNPVYCKLDYFAVADRSNALNPCGSTYRAAISRISTLTELGRAGRHMAGAATTRATAFWRRQPARRIFSCPQSRPTSEKPRNLFMDP